MNVTVILLALDTADSGRCTAVCAQLGLHAVWAESESAFVRRLLEPRARQVGLVVPGGGLDVENLVTLVRGIYRLRTVPLVIATAPPRIVGSPELPDAEVEQATAALLGATWDGPAANVG